MNKLDQKYFKTLHKEVNNNYEYSVIKPLNQPMILYSKKNYIPLASLHFLPQDNEYQNETLKNMGRSLITKRPYKSDSLTELECHHDLKCDFQGLINMDHQEIKFVITNLSDTHYINFNIINRNTQVGLNEINEIRPYESYSVKCNSIDNGVLVLNSVTKKVGDGATKVKVEDDDKVKNVKDSMGTYYYLSVTPDTSDPNKDYFEDTFWTCSDVFCTRTKYVKPKNSSATYGPQESIGVTGPQGYYAAHESVIGRPTLRQLTQNTTQLNPDTLHQAQRGGYMVEQSGTISRPLRQLTQTTQNSDNLSCYDAPDLIHIKDEGKILCKLLSERNSANDANNETEISIDINDTNNINETDETNEAVEKLDMLRKLGELAYNGIKLSQNYSMDSNYKAMKYEYELHKSIKEKSENFDIKNYLGSMMGSSILETANNKFNPFDFNLNGWTQSLDAQSLDSKSLDTDTIKKSLVGNISSGDRKITVHARKSGHTYDYSLTSSPCVLGLSISEGLEFGDDLENDKDLLEIGKEILQKMIDNDIQELLDELENIYTDILCVICLSSDDPLDTVFYQCGHKCTHYECSKELYKCPLCRSYITAKIRIKQS